MHLFNGAFQYFNGRAFVLFIHTDTAPDRIVIPILYLPNPIEQVG